MRLSVRFLDNVSNVNHWNYTDSATIFEGQPNDIYFQLVDAGKFPHYEATSIPMRYVPQAGSSVTIDFPSLDDASKFSLTATQPFSEDKSIWKMIVPSNKLPSSGAFQITITESGIAKSFMIRSGIRVELLNIGSC